MAEKGGIPCACAPGASSVNAAVPRTRFAPSPTGELHAGNVRTALYNLLLARHGGGTFLLRIEDTDAARQSGQGTAGLCADLRWCGIEWDEGFDAGGRRGPYRQSQRRALHDCLLERLLDAGHAYECWLTPAELRARRDAARRAGHPPRHRRRDSALDAAELAARREAGARPVLRFEMPVQGADRFVDLVRGEQRFPAGDMGDFVVRRADGTPAFLFANAVDDAMMGITHVLRGDDHISNTPRQIALLEALELPVPEYGHLPLVVDSHGAPLSKRQREHGIASLREAGFLPEAVINCLARLGHPYPGDELLDLDALAAAFDIAALGHSPARFDPAQLSGHWQPLAVRSASSERLWHWLDDDTRQLVPAPRRDDFLAAVRPNILLPADAGMWARVLFAAQEPAPMAREAATQIEHAGAEFFARAAEAVQAHGTDLATLVEALLPAAGGKRARVLKPLRAAVTGRLAGPELQALMSLLGAQRLHARLVAAAARAGGDSR